MGSGLGMALAKGIVTAHHGRIWAESEPGEGAEFRDSSATTTAKDVATTLAGVRVLIVDDSTDNLAVLRAL